MIYKFHNLSPIFVAPVTSAGKSRMVHEMYFLLLCLSVLILSVNLINSRQKFHQGSIRSVCTQVLTSV